MADDVSTKNSKLVLDGDEKLQAAWAEKILERRKDLEADKNDRKTVYQVRNDFYTGNQAKYTNVVGLGAKEKKGHANAVINYAGKTIVKIGTALAINPPKLDFPVDEDYSADDKDYESEEIHTQAVENFTNKVFRRNMFWHKAYRRGVFNQVKVGDFAIKIYPQNIGTADKPVWEIKIVNHEKMENLLVGWRGDDSKEFDFVIAEELRSLQSIKKEFGIDVDKDDIIEEDASKVSSGSSHSNNNQWGQKNLGATTLSVLPSGKNTIPSAWVREYDDEDAYCIMIGKKIVQLALKDDITMPKIKFWVLGENIPNTGSHWSMSDIDYLIDPQIELNEASNEERDYIRVGANQKYVAYNMEDFNPEDVKTGSGGVIMISSPDGTARFEPLQTNVNTYPADTYLSRMKKHIHDLGVPEVSFGTSGSDSGKSKVMDYQTVVDLVNFKQDSWELVMYLVCEKIQRLAFFYFKSQFFTDVKTGQFKVRLPDFDWTDIVPITMSDRIVNVINKVQMGLPFRYAWKELGYRDVDAIIAEMKKEANDKDLMIFRSKMWQLAQGLALAQAQSQMMANPGLNPNADAENPTLTPSQNSNRELALPVSQRGTTANFSSAKGVIERQRQNAQAAGK